MTRNFGWRPALSLLGLIAIAVRLKATGHSYDESQSQYTTLNVVFFWLLLILVTFLKALMTPFVYRPPHPDIRPAEDIRLWFAASLLLGCGLHVHAVSWAVSVVRWVQLCTAAQSPIV